MNELSTYGIIPISFDIVADAIGEYRSPKDKISRMEQQGELIRLKKGYYVVAPKITNQLLSVELIANHLYGPSYVSLESALSYYSLIPERVYTTLSITVKRARAFDNPIGRFEYLTMPSGYYSIGIRQEVINGRYSFLIASPEKAICDLIITTAGLRIQSERAMREYLFEDMRIDIDEYKSWDLNVIRQCIAQGRKRRELNLLLKVLQNG